MKSFYLLTLLTFSAVFASAQIVDQFNFTGTLATNGWTTHSGTAGQFSAITTASDQGNSLYRTGLPASVGNRTQFVSGNTEDVNHAITGVTGTGYYSFLMKVPSTTGMNATGDHFIGFGATANSTTTGFGGRVYIKTGSVAGTFRLGIANTAAAANATYLTTDYSLNTTYFIVVKFNTTLTPTVAEIFVNPVPGSAEPVSNASNSAAAGSFAALASVYLRQGTNTGNIEIDEIRAGSTWASVTPSGCATSSAISVTACGTYNFHGTVLNASGNYTHVLTNGNAQGCDSTINLALTINQPTTSTITASSCGNYTLNGTTYNTSGTYTQVIQNTNNCDSTITLNLSIVGSVTYYEDLDVDGFGNPVSTFSGCSQPFGYVTNDDDCDDNNNAIGVATVTYYTDADGDSFGNPATGVVACTQPVGSVTNGNDCDDNNNAIGVAVTWYADLDGDTYGDPLSTPITSCIQPADHVANATDCNDNNNAIHPGAVEIPDNGVDEDCSGSDLSTALGIYEFTAAGACPVVAVDVTTQPANATFGPYSNSGAVCASANNVFNNNTWNMTADVDLTEYNQFYIVPADCYSMDLTAMSFDHKISGSGGTPFIHVRSSVDNFAADIHTTQLLNDQLTNVSFTLPAAFEDQTDTVYFRIYVTAMAAAGATYRNDNVKLSGSLSALSTQTFYADADGDTFGDASVSVVDCEAPAGYVSDNTDCDDDNADAFPGAVWYQDTDLDTYGNPAVSLTQCTQPAGYVADNTDCSDTDADSNPGVEELCDGLDNNCDGQVDEEFNLGESCNCGGVLVCGPNGTSVCSVPEVPEICDGIDNNCNGLIDEGFTPLDWFEDADGDTYGNPDEMVSDCVQPAGYVANDEDCNDSNAAINPNATEITGNGIDENCDNLDGTVGIEEKILSAAVVFPNPGTESVTVSVMNTLEDAVTVTLVSSDGKVLLTQQMINGITTMDTQAVARGIYMIRVSAGSATAIVRWVKN